MTKRLLTGLSLALAVFAVVAWSSADEAAPVLSDPPMQSIGALEFADGVLFAGDSRGGTLYALQVGGGDGSRPERFEAVGDLDGKIAEMLGTSAREVFIKDLAVDQSSGNAYVSVMRGSGADAQPALFRVTPAGAIEHVAFESLEYTRLQLADAPEDTPDARRNPRLSTITDIEMLGEEVYVAGLSNEEFASVIRRASWPFEANAEATGLEIYHGAHGQFETHAPVYTFMPIELEGEAHVLAGYLCTPLVTFSLDEMKSADRMRGKTIAELGFGNVPVDMLHIDQGEEEYVLLTNSRRGSMKISMDDIRAAQKLDSIEESVGPRTGVDYLGSPLGLVVQVDNYGDGAILILERDPENGSLRLSARENRWI